VSRDNIFDEKTFTLNRESSFSYKCNACSRCCYEKEIRVSSYEILLLSRELGISTTQFIAQYTKSGGTVLNTREEDSNACVFLGENGCTVHSNRPLVCRLYPLGIRIDENGVEKVGHARPHPETEGVYGEKSTVNDYFEAQGVTLFLEISRKYRKLYDLMLDHLENMDESELEKRSSRRKDVDETEAGIAASPWVDIDLVVNDYCKLKSKAIPTNIDDLVTLHIEAVENWIETY
jgi:uncharacterized protein